jgi:hypothetical protein
MPQPEAGSDPCGGLEIREMARYAGLTLSEQHLTELAATFPYYAAMAARIPRGRARWDELAHVFNPARTVSSI